MHVLGEKIYSFIKKISIMAFSKTKFSGRGGKAASSLLAAECPTAKVCSLYSYQPFWNAEPQQSGNLERPKVPWSQDWETNPLYTLSPLYLPTNLSPHLVS